MPTPLPGGSTPTPSTVVQSGGITLDLSGMPVPGAGAQGPRPYGEVTSSPRPSDEERAASGYRYFYGDEVEITGGMSEENLARVQDQLAAIGWLGGYVPGVADNATMAAFGQLLDVANGRDEPWAAALQYSSIMAAGRDAVADGATDNGEGTVYLPPDYGDLSQQVKGMFKDRLRREPTDAELAILADELSRRHRQQFDSTVSALEVADNVGAGRIVEGQTISQNPVELFEKRYGSEIKEVENTEDHKVNREMGRTVLDSFGRIGQ